MCRDLNVVVVGLGVISGSHIDAIVHHAKLYGVCDIVRQKADDLAVEYGCKAFYSIDDVLKDDKVESVHICTPHYLHLEMALACSAANKAVVIEKPACMNLAEYEKLRTIKTKAMVVLQNRYNNSIVHAKEKIAKMGKLIGIKAILLWRRTPEYYLESDWRGKWATEGGGFLINQALHTLDLIAYFGGEIEKIEGSIHNRTLRDVIEVEDTAEATIYFKNGVKAFFFGSNGYPTNTPYDIELTCENGSLRYAYGKLFHFPKGEVIAEDLLGVGEKAYWGRGHDEIISRFYGGRSYPHIEDYRPVAKILNKLYETRFDG